jgi:hypothetical protein
MSDDAEGRRILHTTIEGYLKEREKFCLGFVRFVLERGLDTKAPPRDGKPPETWRQAGQRLYGMRVFEATLAAEVAARREAYDAKSRLSPVRGDKGKAGRQRNPARAGEN